MLFFGLTKKLELPLGWNRDSFERWCYPSQLGALCYRNEASQALPGRLVTRPSARLEHPSKLQRTVGVVELLEEMKREQIATTKTPTGLERSELMVPPFFGQKIWFFARQEKCEIWSFWSDVFFFHRNLWNTHSFRRSSHRAKKQMQKRRRFVLVIGSRGGWKTPCAMGPLFRVGFLHFPWVWY